jgi:hypothetical protein
LVGGPTRFARSSTSSVLLWRAHVNGDLFRSHTGLSPSVVGLSRPLCWERFCNPSVHPQPRDESRFGLVPRSLAATDGIDVSFCSSRYLDVSVPWVRFLNLCIQLRMTLRPGFPIQISPDQSLLPAPRRFSQAATSFFAFYCQGIHPVRLFT